MMAVSVLSRCNGSGSQKKDGPQKQAIDSGNTVMDVCGAAIGDNRPDQVVATFGGKKPEHNVFGVCAGLIDFLDQ